MVLRYPLFNITELPQPAILKPRPRWAGKQVFSLLLPPITYRRGEVRIVKGELLEGRMTKTILGSSSGGLIHVLCKLYGNQIALNFMSDCQLLMNLWMEGVGFSIGMDDYMLDQDTSARIQLAIDQTVDHANRVNHLGKKLGIKHAKRERHVSGILSKLLDTTGGMAQSTLSAETNSLVAIIAAGSKGNKINIAQIMTCVGQQSVEGHRVFDVTNPEARNLAAFGPDEDSVHSRGFISHSYVQGLSPTEMFFHTMAGREGIVDTSVKTADTGYIQRKITKALETFNIAYDGTVRDASQNVVDFVYGGDNCDAQYLEKVRLECLNMSLDALEAQLEPEEYKMMVRLRRQCLETKLSIFVRTLNDVAYLPVNVPLLLQQCSAGTCPLNKEELWEEVTGVLHWLEEMQGVQTLYLRTSILYHLRYSAVKDTDLNRDFFKDLRRRYHQALIQPGESVGVLAAESVGHPCTQLTLNTFHSVRSFFFVLLLFCSFLPVFVCF